LQEVQSLDRARAALRQGRPALASQHLARHVARFPSGELQLEADVLRVEAWHASGNQSRARSLAQQLLKRPLAERYRQRLNSLMQQPGSTTPRAR
jgi:hypothetical protein